MVHYCFVLLVHSCIAVLLHHYNMVLRHCSFVVLPYWSIAAMLYCNNALMDYCTNNVLPYFDNSTLRLCCVVVLYHWYNAVLRHRREKNVRWRWNWRSSRNRCGTLAVSRILLNFEYIKAKSYGNIHHSIQTHPAHRDWHIQDIRWHRENCLAPVGAF